MKYKPVSTFEYVADTIVKNEMLKADESMNKGMKRYGSVGSLHWGNTSKDITIMTPIK